MDNNSNAAERVLMLFCRLMRRERLNKQNIAMEYQITGRSVNRDFLIIREVLAELREGGELLFDRSDESYYFSQALPAGMDSMEVMAFLKVLLGARAFRQDEVRRLVDSIRSLLPEKESRELYRAIEDDLASYVAPLHQKALVKMQWDLSRCIAERRKILLNYTRHDDKMIQRKVLPVQIVFSEFYFYLVAFRLDENYDYPAFFRLDRIDSFELLGKLREPMQETRFRFGEMRPAVPFMYGGKLETITFRCKKFSMEAILDRIMDYQIIKEKGDDAWVVANTFDEGFLRWAAMQGTAVEILRPKRLRNKMVERCKEILKMYEPKDKEDDD